MVGLPFIGIAFIETIVFTHRIYSFLVGKFREELLQEAATRAATQIKNRQLEESARESILAAPHRLPPEVGKALEDGRLQITVKDDEDRDG